MQLLFLSAKIVFFFFSLTNSLRAVLNTAANVCKSSNGGISVQSEVIHITSCIKIDLGQLKTNYIK